MCSWIERLDVGKLQSLSKLISNYSTRYIIVFKVLFYCKTENVENILHVFFTFQHVLWAETLIVFLC